MVAVISIGIDVSTRKIAVAGIRDTGGIVTRALELNPKVRGARRLVAARTVAHAALGGHSREAAIIVVEAPIAHGANNDTLRAVASVVLEAAQASCPGATVMDAVPSHWRKVVLGHGNANKDDAFRYAAGLGYTGDDDDIAEALCIAQLGWMRWEQATRDRAA